MRAARLDFHGHILPLIRQPHLRAVDRAAPLQRSAPAGKFDIAIRHIGSQKIDDHLEPARKLRDRAGSITVPGGFLETQIDCAANVEATLAILESKNLGSFEQAFGSGAGMDLPHRGFEPQSNLSAARIDNLKVASREGGRLL